MSSHMFLQVALLREILLTKITLEWSENRRGKFNESIYIYIFFERRIKKWLKYKILQIVSSKSFINVTL